MTSAHRAAVRAAAGSVSVYGVRAWCDENSANGTYRVEAQSEMDARRTAVERFREDCAMAGALVQPKTVHTAIDPAAIAEEASRG